VEAVATRLVVLLAVFGGFGTASAQDTSDRSLVLAAVQTFLDVIGNRDVEAAKRVMLPEGRLISSREEDGKLTLRPQTHQEFFDSLAKGSGRNLERMWNPEVRIHGTIATVSTPYDFHRDGKFSHCGTDVFNLVKTAEGWKIAGAMWTVQRIGCAPSPLGPPK
jgi:hypothetical protein